jgi:hypothetical protein
MTAASAAVAAPAAVLRRHRCLGFVSAVVLFVLLAAAGLPMGSSVAASQCVEAGERAAVHAVRRAVRRECCAAVVARGAAAGARPRPVSRQRCMPARGLPPARAPCS